MTRLAPALLVTLAALALPATAGAGEPAPACDVVAAVEGNDADAGTADAPVRSVRRAVELLEPGQAACLTAGETFHELVNFNPSGTTAAPLTLRSTPGGRAAFTGQIRVNGSHVRISGIDFRGLGAVASFAPKTYHLGVDGDDVELTDLEITSPKGICVDVGQIDVYGANPGPRADGFVLEHSRIHGCGLANDLTGEDSGIHGIYLKYTSGARLSDLYVHDNVNRGIQLWPAASDTLIERVTLEGSGSNLNLGSYAPNGYFTTDTVVRRSVIANSRLRSCSGCDVPPGDTANVVGNFPAGSPDHGNRIEDDCVFQSDPARNFEGAGFTQTGNRFERPAYVDREAGDLRQAAGSPCEGYGATGSVPAPSEPLGGTTPGGTPPGGARPGGTTPGATTSEGTPHGGITPTPAGPTPAPATRRTRAGRLLVVALRTRCGVRVRVLTPRPGRLRLRVTAPGRRRALAARTVTVRRRSATTTLRLRSMRRHVRLTVTFRDRDGRTASRTVPVG